MTGKPHVFLIGEIVSAAALSETFRTDGFEVRNGASVADAIELARQNLPEIVVIDIHSPDFGTLELCRRLRAETKAGVMVIADSVAADDTIAVLEAGADCYIHRSAGLGEVLARVRSLIRRLAPLFGTDNSKILWAGNLMLDPVAHRACLGSAELGLTLKEFGVLQAFMTDPGLTLSFELLYQKVWGTQFTGRNAIFTVHTHVLTLKRKIRQHGATTTKIVAVKGIGYRFESRPEPSHTVLVIHDNQEILDQLKDELVRLNLEIQLTGNGVVGRDLALSDSPDLIILEVALPGLDGLSICRAVRRKSAIPIIAISNRDSESDRLLAFEAGADDYVVWPFDRVELIARIHTLWRRVVELENERHQRMQVGEVLLDLSAHRAFLGQRELKLGNIEFKLLALLMHHSGQPVSRRMLYEQVWDKTYSGDDHTLDVHIQWLRQKLAQEATGSRYITTIRNEGYLFGLES